MNKIKMNFTIVAMLALFSTASFAEGNSEIYVGAGIGVSKMNVQGTSGNTVSYTGSSLQLLVGRQINQKVAVEVEYVDLGKLDLSNVSITSTGIGVSGIGIMPLQNDFSLYGKVGLASVTTTSTAKPGWVLLVPASESRAGVSLGVGAQYDSSPKTTLRLSIDSYPYSALGGALAGRVAMYSVAGIFKF
jgi:OOP family OmpA-OmpF porin